jgi:hypothetical protein
MRLIIRISMLIGFSVGTSVHSQEVGVNESASHRPPSMVARLKAEAAKMETAEISPLFKALVDPKNSRDLCLSPEQLDLVRRLEELTRHVIKAWLLRDLDARAPTTPAALSERLAEGGKRLRNRLVAQAEAIVFEGILNPVQARILRNATGQKATALLPGREGPPEMNPADEQRSSAELAEHLRCLPTGWPNSGPVTIALLGKPGMREAYPHGIDHLDPVHKELARRDMPKVDLTEEQIILVERLDKLILAIWKSWLIRDLDKTPLPPQPVLARRLCDGCERLRQSLFARAEIIALQGIVTPEQADRVLTAVWELCGMSALLDPTLAARLRLTRTQREEVLFLLESKKDINKNLDEAGQRFWHLVMSNPEARAQTDRLVQDADNRKQEVDDLILSEVLTSSQARALARILDSTKQPATRPAGKAKKSNRPG